MWQWKLHIGLCLGLHFKYPDYCHICSLLRCMVTMFRICFLYWCFCSYYSFFFAAIFHFYWPFLKMKGNHTILCSFPCPRTVELSQIWKLIGIENSVLLKFYTMLQNSGPIFSWAHKLYYCNIFLFCHGKRLFESVKPYCLMF